ncbi:MAG: hypothetical protein UT24_C0002G0038 [Candidatus Woesebacteria bacterium GW2011_GWB1_39_12]|uniref:Nudix hydrolase domain-containing protein n=2 Tax=Candidatus Woeseibacteriota TaxID=1752722 RepID=A0A0G0PGQ2_9BACT|nr:MAG: hypothetical protein UT23_C0014G0025 [Candidatus Woesebacteria bacterium GW2011_GWA1_39_12]KKR01775.1 MAG: hypothetical protein UT24_C0002G0038 [Candidatus Woesebacteria bacterium GW2011_GWB1_39_12]
MKHVVVGIISKRVKGIKKYLLVSSVLDYGKYTGFYYPPGGHMEKGEDLKVALVGKIKKELFIDVVPIRELAETSSDIKDQITHWWLCKAVIKKLNYDRERLKDVRWFTQEEIKEGKNIWPATKKFFQK